MVLVALAATYVLARLLPSRSHRRRPPPDAARVAMATAMAFTGVSHLVNPKPFVQHLPAFVPAREQVILGTGLLEMLFGAGLAAPSRRRREVALALAAYLIAVFPANVYVAATGKRIEGLPGASHPWLRLPFQGVYVAWAFWAVPGLLGAGPHTRTAAVGSSGPNRAVNGCCRAVRAAQFRAVISAMDLTGARVTVVRGEGVVEEWADRVRPHSPGLRPRLWHGGEQPRLSD